MGTIDVWTPPREEKEGSSERKSIWKRARRLVQPGSSINHNGAYSKKPAIPAERHASTTSRILKLFESSQSAWRSPHIDRPTLRSPRPHSPACHTHSGTYFSGALSGLQSVERGCDRHPIRERLPTIISFSAASHSNIVGISWAGVESESQEDPATDDEARLYSVFICRIFAVFRLLHSEYQVG